VQTFAQFIEQRDITRTYLSEQFTVLALYAEYVNWLSRGPQEDKEAPGRFSVSALLLQLELINQYQIRLLEEHRHANNHQPIVLSKVPEYLTRQTANYLNNRPERINLPTEAIPLQASLALEESNKRPPRQTVFLILGFLCLALSCTVGGFFLAYNPLVTLPPAALPAALGLGYAGISSTVRSLLDLKGFPPLEHRTNKTIAILTAVSAVSIAAYAVLPLFFPVPLLVKALLHTVGFMTIAYALDQGVGKMRLAVLQAHKAKYASGERLLETLEEIDSPDHPETSLAAWKEPIMAQVQNICEQPPNKLDEATTATTHCLLASQYSGIADATLSIHELDHVLHRRLRA
jgi:hypothetical protein